MKQAGKISLYTATAIVVANMIGTGVFTSLGYQVMDIKSVFPLLMLWVTGGVTALAGALSYGELAATLPRSGGEYHFLRETWHPAVGFVAGWVSLTVGFAAPTALAAMALGHYAHSVLPGVNASLLAAAVVLCLTAIHATSKNFGSYFQNIFTTIKVIIIIVFIGVAFTIEVPQNITILPQKGDWELLLSPGFAVSLIYVSYAYTGWNAAAYITSEMDNPRKNVPLALLQGTFLVMLLYVLLNYVFLFTTPISELEGQVEVGYLASIRIFGPTGGKAMGLVIATLLVSTVSAMVFAGPRVMQMIGQDLPAFKLFAKTRNGIPANAVLLQAGLTLIFIVTSSFEQVLTYAGFTLSLITFLTVSGLFVLRIRRKDLERSFKVPLYPFTPAVFLLLVGWTLTFLLREKPLESLAGLATVCAGLGIFFLLKKPEQSDDTAPSSPEPEEERR